MTKVVDLCNKHLFFCLPLCSVQLDKSWFRFLFGLSVWPKLSTTLIFRFMTLSLNPNGIFFILYFNMSEQIIHHDGRYIHKSFTDFNHIISTFQFISFNTLIFLSLSCFHMSFPYPPHLISTMMISHVVDPHHLSLSLSPHCWNIVCSITCMAHLITYSDNYKCMIKNCISVIFVFNASYVSYILQEEI